MKPPLGIQLLIAFFWFGAAMSGLSFISLLFPGSFLEPMWRLNPRARVGFTEMGSWAVPLMFVVCLACACAAIGSIRQRKWGWYLAITILAVNMAGDIGNATFGHDPRTWIGVPIALLVIGYLLRPQVRAQFK